MPIGLVNDNDLMEELTRLNPALSRSENKSVPSLTPLVEKHPEVLPQVVIPEIQELPTRGRNEGDVNIPDSLRQIIGEESVINGRKSAIGLAGMFGISPSSVSAYAKGATSTDSYNTPSKSIIGHINKSRERAIKRASRTLNAALGAITQDKLDYTDAKDLSGIAKDMSVVIKNLEPPPTTDTASGIQPPQFVIFAPTFKDERSYDTITVQE